MGITLFEGVSFLFSSFNVSVGGEMVLIFLICSLLKIELLSFKANE